MTPVLGSSLPFGSPCTSRPLGPGSAPSGPTDLPATDWQDRTSCFHPPSTPVLSRDDFSSPWLGSALGTLADLGCPPRAVRSWGQGGLENRAQQVTWTVSDAAWRMRRLGSRSLKTPPYTFPSAPWALHPMVVQPHSGHLIGRLGSLLPQGFLCDLSVNLGGSAGAPGMTSGRTRDPFAT